MHAKLIKVLTLALLWPLFTLTAGQNEAFVSLHPASGSQVTGQIRFIKEQDGVRVAGYIEGLTPGKHAIHIHEKGDCQAADASSAGAHFNPQQKPHGAPESEERHLGDLGNIEADEDGIAEFKFVDKKITLDGPDSIIGKALIIHEKEDDFKTQPTGAAGARVACGVIETQI